MKARDAMDPELVGTYDCQGLEALLLAQTPEGEGVYIAPDGTLMRVTAEIDSRQGDRILRNDDSDLMFDPDESYPDDDWLYRLVPIEEEP